MFVLPHASVSVMGLGRAIDHATRDRVPAFPGTHEMPGLSLVDAAADQDIAGCFAEGTGFAKGGGGDGALFAFVLRSG